MNFLEDTYRIKFSGNISDLEKRDTLVTVFVDDYVFPNMPPFTTTIKNLIAILIEFVRLKDLEVNKIIITLNDDVVTISGE